MEDAPQAQTRFMNPWVLHFQKLGLELKCPLCLNLYNKPMLLPCNHIFCSCCVPESNLFGSECAICKLPYNEQELREAPYIENLVNIYRSLDVSFSMHMLNSEVGKGTVECPVPAKRISKEPIDSSSPGNATSGTANVPLMGNGRVMLSNSTSAVTMLERCSAFANTGLRPVVLENNFQSNVTSFSQGKALQQDRHAALDVDINRVELFPDSPPSSGASKDDTAEKCQSKTSSKRAIDDFGAPGASEHLDSHCKKQKQADLSQVELPNFKCAFCKTGKVTQGSGPLHHFVNGEQVSENEADRSDVVHLHQSCIEWTPQIYYENDTTIRNVDKELARAEKLKCTSCGLKGAALGCFAKSCRRTYHAPCAYDIPKCRWDIVDFLMLCPSHASQKFPSEKSRKSAAKKPSSVKINDEPKKSDLSESDSWTPSPTGTENWVLCASSLSSDQKSMLVKFANLCGATVTKNWTPEVTHVIATTDANGACSRTLKVLMAILKGKWVLKTDWVKACMELKRPVDEEPYEINLDNHGCCDGPKTGRLRALSNEPKLFSDMNFHFIGDLLATYQWDLQDLIVAGGGTVLETREQLQQSSPWTTLVVYNDDAVTGTKEESSILQRQVEAEMVAAEIGAQVIPHTWLLGSIASNKLQAFV